MYRVVKYGFLALLVASPLMFGSVHPWAIGTVEVWILILAGLWLWAPNAEKVPFSLKQAWPFLFLIGFLIVVFFQAIPLPKQMLEHVAPNNVHAWTRLDLLGINKTQSVS